MYTLFEILTENITSKTILFDITTLHKSIQSHLTLLLNSRQGSLQHLPNYGLPDLNKIYQELPHSLNLFTRMLKEVIEKYEPRLTNVLVKYKSMQQNDCVIYFEICAQIYNGTSLLFDTYFMPDGNAVIQVVQQ